MIRPSILAVIACLASICAFPAENGAVAARLRPRAIRPNIVPSDSVGTSFLLPVVGNTAGKFGTFFRSEAIFSNFLDVPQRIAITVLPQGASGGNPPIIRELPSYENGGDLGLVSENILGDLGGTGLAALVVQAVDTNGNPDPNARIDGFTRIWTEVPNTATCLDPHATMSQSLFAVPTNSLSGSEFSGFAVGLRQDENFRTNVGIVNASSASHTWTVEVDGNRASTSFRMTVPGNSMIQAAVPDGIYGNATVIFTADPSSASFNWAAYASSVDNRSGDGWTRQASY